MPRPNLHCVAWLLALVGAASGSAAWGQSLSERIADYKKRKQNRQQTRTSQDRTQANVLARNMNRVIGPIQLDGVPAREAFEWWSSATKVPMVINWNSLENEGIDPETPIRLRLRRAGASTVLRLFMEQTAQDEQPLVYRLTPWYLQIVSRNEAMRQSVTRTYYIGDLLVRLRSFRNAPSLGTSGSSNEDDDDNSSSSGSNSNNSNDDDDDDDGSESSLSTLERADQIAQLIRDTVEPDIWVANGGEHASITYFQQKLIVRAPMFVHRQIGGATVPSTARRSSGIGVRSGVVRTSRLRPRSRVAPRRSVSTGVSSVGITEPTPISGVEEKH